MSDSSNYPTQDEYLAALHRYTTPSIAQILKVSEVAVETWKSGDPEGYPVQWRRIIELLQDKGARN